MANRHLARSVALQSLYAWDFAGNFKKVSSPEQREGRAERADDGERATEDAGNFLGETRSQATEDELREIASHAIEEYGPNLGDDAFVWQLINGVIAKQPVLDRVIENAAPEWAIDRITIVDRNILRLGLWELLFGSKEEVPPKVAINEAIELAKSFGAHSSGRFVNGVLGTVYRELHQESDQKTETKHGH